jgi:hypothetical protein
MSGGNEEDWFENEYLRNQKEGNREESITLDVIKDLKSREQFGALKYGKFLTPHSNEDMMQHLYEELLDAALYIKCEMKKRDCAKKVNENPPFDVGYGYS